MLTKTKSQDLIACELDDSVFSMRATDGYINATELCYGAGRDIREYLKLDRTKSFFLELGKKLNDGKSTHLKFIETKKGRYGGTWVHPRVAINLAQWISPEFDVYVSGIVFDFLSGGGLKKKSPKFPKQPKTPDRIQATIATKSLNDVIISKLSQAPDKIFLHVEEKIHKAITRMTASYHKKKMNGTNGIDLLGFYERGALVYAKDLLIMELEKHPNFSLTRAEIREITDKVCLICQQLVSMYEEKNVLDKGRYIDILPAKEQKTMLLVAV